MGEFMKKRENYKLLSLTLGMLVIAIIILYLVITERNNNHYYLILDDSIIINDDLLNIFFFDVGQGDSTFIMKNGYTMLIDGGNDWNGKEIARHLRYLNVERIDFLVATHMHADHIGGLDTIINNFEIGYIFMPESNRITIQENQFLDAIEENNLKRNPTNIGDIFYLGYARNEILFVNNDVPRNPNLTSIVIQMTYGNQVFLFMADSVRQIEDSIEWNDVNVLRVGHHGSNTSSTERFLNQTNSEIAIISVGRNNAYNHPHEAVLYRLNNVGAIIYRTDERGTIWLRSNGIYSTIRTER